MATTNATLLERICVGGDEQAWSEFYDIYAPLIYRFSRKWLPVDEAEEVRDRCLEELVRKLPDFKYDARKGRFRAWLGRMVHFRAIDMLRKRHPAVGCDEVLAEIPNTNLEPSVIWNRLWEFEHLKYCLARIGTEVSERNYAVFRLLTIEQNSVSQVCEKLNMSANQVYKITCDMKTRIRRKAEELGLELEDS